MMGSILKFSKICQVNFLQNREVYLGLGQTFLKKQFCETASSGSLFSRKAPS